MSGWVKIHRSLREHWVWNNPEYFKAWICIILEANYEFAKVLIEGEVTECERGQSLNSLKTWARLFGNRWSIQRVRTFLNLLKKDSMIVTEGLRKTTRLTVCNYDKYQVEQQADNTEITRRQHGDNTEVTTNKKNKKNKNEIEKAEFDNFWNLYDKKVGDKEKLFSKWNNLTKDEKESIFNYLPEYKKAQPDKNFRKNPDRFLNNKSWNDELIFDGNKTQSNESPIILNADEQKKKRDDTIKRQEAIKRGEKIE